MSDIILTWQINNNFLKGINQDALYLYHALCPCYLLYLYL